MNIILKTSIKNIFGKPLRTLLVAFSIFLCSICAMVCFDFVSSAEKLLSGSSLGLSKADCLFMASDYTAKGLPEGFPECEKLEIVSNIEKLYKPIESEYNYVTYEKLTIFGVNVDSAVKMEFIDPVELGLCETVITGNFAEAYGYKVGDKLIVHDRQDEEVELTVVGISYGNSNYFISKYTAIVNEETSKILSCGRDKTGVVLFDILNQDEALDGIRALEEYYPSAVVINFVVDESVEATLHQLLLYFYLIFAITFLLVIFVSASICNRIVSERMPFIGTLRSLGMSNAKTGRILLLENTLYALIGSIPGIILYGLIRVPVLDMFFGVQREGSNFKSEIPPMSALVIAAVIIGAIIIECAIPAKAIMKALNTSIRDIIFDNRDTAYKFSKSGLIIGLVLVAGAVVSAFFSKNLIVAIICLVCSVTSLALLYPWIFKGVTGLLKNIADKKENAKLSLACVEAISRKSTVGSGVLCVTAAAMCVIVFTFVQSATMSVSTNEFTSDVILTCTDKMTVYSFVDKLEGVTDTEVVYTSSNSVTINDADVSERESMTFYALPENGFKYYTAFPDLPATMENGTIIVSDKYAEKKGLNVGDTVKITYDPTSIVPVEREYKIVSLCSSDSLIAQECIFLSDRDYKEIFRDTPGYILIMCENPARVANLIRTYAVNYYSDVKTQDEILKDEATNNAKMRALTAGIIVISVGITLIGMASNQLIGFEGRKKECAVMLSTAMGKGTLSGILFREMLISSLTASALGTTVGILMVFILDNATSASEEMKMAIEIDPIMTIAFFVFLVAAFVATVLFPIKNLRKMKIAEQIKYE